MSIRNFIKGLDQMARRRARLAKQWAYKCPCCGEPKQIQLIDQFVPIAKWRCRMCGQRFYYEPVEEVGSENEFRGHQQAGVSEETIFGFQGQSWPIQKVE